MHSIQPSLIKAQSRIESDIDVYLANGGKIKHCTVEDNRGYTGITTQSKNRKLSQAKVNRIRKKLDGLSGVQRMAKTEELANHYGVSYHTVRKLVHGVAWRNAS